MDSIRIDNGEKRICVNDDPSRVIVFNPSDIVFAEKFYNLIGNFETRLTEYQGRSADIDADKSTDGNGLPANLGQRMALLREACQYIRDQIDVLFGFLQPMTGDAIPVEHGLHRPHETQSALILGAGGRGEFQRLAQLSVHSC